jgi:hypothetical protein
MSEAVAVPTVMVERASAAAPVASDTCTNNWNVPVVVGVPLIVPVLVSMFNPGGRPDPAVPLIVCVEKE